ncbi:hypothetical protein GCM10020260_20070 [Nesterenkonia halobia]|uniref:Uncharacterized protein n=1 Tax=Nesterenkonia halobia TaxID=37922 RepID=A0ABP6RDL7_9MICC
MGLEDLPQRVEHMQLHEALVGKPLGEAGEGGRTCHGGCALLVIVGMMRAVRRGVGAAPGRARTAGPGPQDIIPAVDGVR